MKKLILPIIMGCLCVSFTNSSSTTVTASAVTDHSPVYRDINFDRTEAASIYDKAALSQYGLSAEAFEAAWKGYQHLLKNNIIQKPGLLTICDFSQSSRKKRFYLVDMNNGKLITQTYVAHGKNTGAEWARHFSNNPESLQSSLGFFVTAETYTGKHGLSLRLKGVDGKFNSKAYERTIVIHGADYVNEGRVISGGYMGRSWGCPSLPKKEAAAIIQKIKEGSCLFIYYPDKKYLRESKILNG